MCATSLFLSLPDKSQRSSYESVSFMDATDLISRSLLVISVRCSTRPRSPISRRSLSSWRPRIASLRHPSAVAAEAAAEVHLSETSWCSAHCPLRSTLRALSRLIAMKYSYDIPASPWLESYCPQGQIGSAVYKVALFKTSRKERPQSVSE